MKTCLYFKDSANAADLPTFDIGSKLTELKQTRQLGSQVRGYSKAILTFIMYYFYILLLFRLRTKVRVCMTS
jgi:hypothetical protein